MKKILLCFHDFAFSHFSAVEDSQEGNAYGTLHFLFDAALQFIEVCINFVICPPPLSIMQTHQGNAYTCMYKESKCMIGHGFHMSTNDNSVIGALFPILYRFSTERDSHLSSWGCKP